MLPQVIIGNDTTFRANKMPALFAACPPNALLMRQRSARNNIAVCERIARLLGAAFKAYPQTVQ